MARDDVQVNFRMPLHLKKALEESARHSGRSVTAELVARLGHSLRREKGVVLDDDRARDIERRLDALRDEIDAAKRELLKP